MPSILETCQPRKDLLTGTFNPEVFTAQLSQVLGHYRGTATAVHGLYADAEQFFNEATFPTSGLKQCLTEVFGRLGGDNQYPAIHRLETAFGGGKTHTLISCTHIAIKGSDLGKVVAPLLDLKLLPKPGSVQVVGISGDEIPVHATKGKKLVPHTLWGEIAFQIGGEALYSQVETEAASAGSPGAPFFDTIFNGRKVLVMLDELAQYTARLEAARTHGSQQLAAFLMSLFGYAKTHSGISIILTLAGQSDAFARQTSQLQKLITQVRGQETSEDAAIAIAETGIKELRSVIARDDNPITPVQASEISRVLAKRLFEKIDTEAAKQTAQAYAQLYARSQSMLPDEATRPDFIERLSSHYPFHPKFIDFLNCKLSTVETFQGTRGVLRVLALAVRRLWQTKAAVPMIHTCHLDLRDARTVNEILGRTGSSDLAPVLNADIGSVDTATLEGGKSNAELADLANPHPEGHPLHEYAWKTVFLHSLVGREAGTGSAIFGIAEVDCCLDTSFPGLTPPQVQAALKEVENRAYYLRQNDGRYYASLDPSVNIALSHIRRTLTDSQLTEVLSSTARKVIGKDNPPFTVLHDITDPGQIPDGQGKPLLAMVSMDAEPVDPEHYVTTKGAAVGRLQQNLVFLLTPNTVAVKNDPSADNTIFSSAETRAEDNRHTIKDLARLVIAMRRLKENPRAHGITPQKLAEQDFDARFRERELALQSAVTQAYNSLWFPSTSGSIVRKEIKTAGGSGGESHIVLIRKALLDDGELVTADHADTAHLTSLANLWFRDGDTLTLAQLRDRFACRRAWPILDSPQVLDVLIRAGVEHGTWCLYRMGSDQEVRPSDFFSREQGALPWQIDLGGKDWSIVTLQGAKKRGWLEADKPAPEKVRTWVRDVAVAYSAGTIDEIKEAVAKQHGSIPEQDIHDAVAVAVKEGRLFVYSGKKEQKERPSDLQTGSQATFYNPKAGDVLVTKAVAAERGWLAVEDRRLVIEDASKLAHILKTLRRVDTHYARGATTTLNALNLEGLVLPGGGKLHLSLEQANKETMKALGELFAILADLAKTDGLSTVYCSIEEPDEGCPFLKELKD